MPPPHFRSMEKMEPSGNATVATGKAANLSFSQFLERKDEAQGVALTSKQIASLDVFATQVKVLPVYKEVLLPSDDFLARFMFARKFEVARAVPLFEKYYTSFGARESVSVDDVFELYKTKVLYLPGTRDRDNAEVIVFNANMHVPSTSFFLYMDLFTYLMDVALQNRLTQLHGFCMILNMRDSSWRMFDVIMLNRFLSQVQDHFPARVSKVLVVDAPIWGTILYGGMRPFMKAKLAAKIKFIDRSALHHHVALQSLPEELEGLYKFNHLGWIDKRKQIEGRSKTMVKARGVHSGFLVYRGVADQSWRRRWTLIQRSKVSVFAQSDDTIPLKTIDLANLSQVKENTRVDDKPLCIELVCPDRTHYFHAESSHSQKAWVTAFRGLIKRTQEELLIDEQKAREAEEAAAIAASEEARKVEALAATERLQLQQEQVLARRKQEEEERRRLDEERKRAEEERRRAEEERRRRIEEEERRRVEEERRAKVHKKRTNIVQELIWTEQSYTETLKMITEIFIKPLRASLDTNKPILSESQLRNVFPEIQAIMGVNVALLSALEGRFSSWSSTQCIGDVFLQMTDSLRIYIGLVNNYSTALDTIIKAQEESSTFKAFLAECQSKPETRMIGLAEHLLTPIQRIPRYVLMLTDLLKNTDQDHPDYANLVKALEQMRQTADYINEMKRRNDSRLRVVEVLEELKGIPDDFELIAPHRTFIMQADAAELEDESGKEELIEVKTNTVRAAASPKFRRMLRLYLFSDILIIAKVAPPKKTATEASSSKKKHERGPPVDARYKLREKIPLVQVVTLADVVIFVRDRGNLRLPFATPRPSVKSEGLGRAASAMPATTRTTSSDLPPPSPADSIKSFEAPSPEGSSTSPVASKSKLADATSRIGGSLLRARGNEDLGPVELANLCLIQIADRRFVVQMSSRKARDEFVTAFTTINPLNKLMPAGESTTSALAASPPKSPAPTPSSS